MQHLMDLCYDYSLSINFSRDSTFYCTRNMTDKLLLIASLQIVLMNLKKRRESTGIMGEMVDSQLAF